MKMERVWSLVGLDVSTLMRNCAVLGEVPSPAENLGTILLFSFKAASMEELFSNTTYPWDVLRASVLILFVLTHTLRIRFWLPFCCGGSLTPVTLWERMRVEWTFPQCLKIWANCFRVMLSGRFPTNIVRSAASSFSCPCCLPYFKSFAVLSVITVFSSLLASVASSASVFVDSFVGSFSRLALVASSGVLVGSFWSALVLEGLLASFC
mmetsp:Transcript_50209/g.60397  ORF Transcript_50209/g.60397 Transcript_50209/m.60397 type:complete len:209 (-) Transcript_50209:602-1228(-)